MKQELPFPYFIQTIDTKQGSLQIAVPVETEIRKDYEANAASKLFPYWSRLWPAAFALTQYLDKHAALIANKTVLEIGAGLGLPSLVASRYASKVICSDYMAEPLLYAKQSAEWNEIVNIDFTLLDINSFPEDIYADVVLMSDVNYEPRLFDKLTNLFNRYHEAGATVVLTTPLRLVTSEFTRMIETSFPNLSIELINDKHTDGTIALFLF